MKKIVSIIALTAASVSFAQTKPKTPVTVIKATVQATIETSAQMKDFMTFLNGESENVEAGLNKYSAKGLDTKNMGDYGLDRPKVTKQEMVNEVDTYTLQVKSGMTRKIYDIGWKNEKITLILDNGIVPGVIEK